MQENAKHIARNGGYLLEEYPQEKKYVYILKLCREIGQSLEESLGGGKLVKNFKIFWVNNKTVIEFGFCMKDPWSVELRSFRRLLST